MVTLGRRGYLLRVRKERGAGNTVSVTNSITNILQNAEQKRWSEKLWLPLGITIAAAVVNK
jgi:hypothetical protein